MESKKATASTDSAGYVEHWARGQRETWFECEREQLPPFVVKQCFSKNCRSLESIHSMESPIRFRHLSPYPHKSVVMAQVFDSVNRWRTEGYDPKLLLMDDAICPDFPEQRAAVWQESNECQDIELKECPCLLAVVNSAPAIRRFLMGASSSHAPHILNNKGHHKPECSWPRHRCEQKKVQDILALQTWVQGKALAGSEDGSPRHVVRRVSINSRVRRGSAKQSACQTGAFSCSAGRSGPCATTRATCFR